ncbi:MAG TPA: 1-(5-phosphoribosyl)-5-[(5-phosphoribosylamino)methylideneamino]imidazole-4-carboxamide isomerase [Anaerolineaceae bacterium]|nr:1-(5-phosphoribosyl)-5-[(5-phosphoribosylamino)methylideneamino]imidazole-4-carboxamide isomerase [Anaerolineaceae bacterium]
MNRFTIYPAIDLMQGKVVRLKEGDPNQQKTYSDEPSSAAARWLDAGAAWLHVVNLDGAFDQPDAANRQALESILAVTGKSDHFVQFGGGLRLIEAVEEVLSAGVQRAVLGTLAVENPGVLPTLIHRWSPDRIAVSLDAREGKVKTHGWKIEAQLSALELAHDLAGQGLRWLIFTDIKRDGKEQGLNIELTRQISEATGLNVIASGGVASEDDIFKARDAGLAGVIVGKALYEGKIDLAKVIHAI